MTLSTTLAPLPRQAPDVPWPTAEWPTAEPDSEVDERRLREKLDEAFSIPPPETHGETLALLGVHRGELVFERYAPGKGARDTFVSWSMAKSITHAVVGLLVGEGRLDIHAPAPIPAWSGADDPRGAITFEQLLRMVDGLNFVEVYDDGIRSDVIDMLFRRGKQNVAAYAEAREPAHPPGVHWNYSSGTTNVVAAALGRLVGGGADGMASFMRGRLFDPLGMKSAKPRFDPAGTFIGSSYVFATARDFARFGLLYLRDAIWEGERLLPDGWVDHARTPTGPSLGEYGAHWWLAMDGSGIFTANGYNGQYIVVVPDRDLVLVRLGVSTPEQRVQVVHGLRAIVECFPHSGGAAATSR